MEKSNPNRQHNIPDHKDTVICHNHWPKDARMVKVRGKFRPLDQPPRSTKRKSSEVRSMQPDEISEWLEREKIKDFDSMKGEIKLKDFNCPLLIFSHLPNEIIVQSVDFVEGTGVPKFLFNEIKRWTVFDDI